MKKIFTLLLLAVFSIWLCACGGPKEITNMPHSAIIGDTQYNGTYTGTVVEKIPNGEGTFYFSDSTATIKYSGAWEDGNPLGEGTIEFDGYVIEHNDTTYTGLYSGETKNGIPNGDGSFSFTKNDDYINYSGTWTAGCFSGNGNLETNLYVINFPDGISRQGEYKGETLDGKASGTGVFSATNDSGNHYTYTGEFENGTFNGFGIRRFDDSSFNVEEGNFENGVFSPTPIQFFKYVGTSKDEEYELTEKSATFLETHPDVFINTSIEGSNLEFEENFKYEAFAKNPSKFGDKLIKVPKLKVVQIFEHTGLGYDYTFCIAQDSSYNVYYFYMLGFADDVYEGDRITLTALPLDYFTYPNTLGQSIWAIACAAVSIT